VVLALCRQLSVILEFLNIVYQTEQIPLALHLIFATQAEAFEILVGPYVAEHRLTAKNGGNADITGAIYLPTTDMR
jgi:hypothetical protein